MGEETDFASYFDSYAKVAPEWQSFIDYCHENDLVPVPGLTTEDLAQLNEDGSPQFIEITEENYPKSYNALKEECNFRV